MDQFPKEIIRTVSTCERVLHDSPKRYKTQTDDIPLVRVSTVNKIENFMEDASEETKIRKFFENQVSWIMGDDGEEFVSMETFQRFTDALILLDVLKQHNVPSVVSFLSRRDEPIAITFSKIQIGLDSLMFCLFQA